MQLRNYKQKIFESIVSNEKVMDRQVKRRLDVEHINSIRDRISGNACENKACGLGRSHSGPCWILDTETAKNHYLELYEVAKG